MDKNNTEPNVVLEPETTTGISKTSFKTRAFKAGSYSFAVSVIVVIIAVVINLLVARLPGKMTKFDLTANSYFTLSDQTEQIVKGLDEDVTLYWLVQTGKEDTYLGELLNRWFAPEN